MSANKLFSRLRDGEVVLGLCNMYPAPGIIEGMCGGWDFVWVDGQHGEMNYNSILHAMHAAGCSQLDTLVRAPGHDHSVLGPIADLSPSAIMVPMVDTPEQAAHIVQGLHFPPKGNRSYGGRRVIDLHGRDYFREQEIMVVAQVETLDAVKNAEAIINTDGIDALFFGPDDMKVRMGLPINTAVNESEELQEAMRTTVAATKAAGKIAGCTGATPESLQVAIDLGYQLMIGGGDIAFMRTAAADKLKVLREVLGKSAGAGPKKGSEVY